MSIIGFVFVLLAISPPANMAPLPDAQQSAQEEYRREEQAIIGLDGTYTKRRRGGWYGQDRMSPRTKNHFTLLQSTPPAASKNSVKIDLTPSSIDGWYVAKSLTVYFKAENGSEYKETFSISGGAGTNGPTVRTVRDTLKGSLELCDWTVTTAGDATITIIGHTDKGKAMSPITLAGAKNNLVEKNQPKLNLSGGVRAYTFPK